MQVHAETYKFSHNDEYGIDRYTVEVTIKGERRALRAYRTTNLVVGEIVTVYDLAVKFRSGEKVWPGRIDYYVDSGKFGSLRACIDKFTRKSLVLVGFFADYQASAARSQHNAV